MIDKVMIVSHPDDEALFGGAELLSHPDEYKVVVLDEYHNDIRRREFIDSMRFIGIHEYEHWTGYKGGEDYHREKLIYELLRVLRERDYKKILILSTEITAKIGWHRRLLSDVDVEIKYLTFPTLAKKIENSDSLSLRLSSQIMLSSSSNK